MMGQVVIELLGRLGGPTQTWFADDTCVPEPDGPKLSLNTRILGFDAPVGGGIGAIQVLSIANIGGAALTIPRGGLLLQGGDAALFQILVSPELPVRIPPGGSLDLPLVFNPGCGEARGAKSATLRVISDASPDSVAAVSLTGSAGDAPADFAAGRILSF
jgi:hypothetical protein